MESPKWHLPVRFQAVVSLGGGNMMFVILSDGRGGEDSTPLVILGSVIGGYIRRVVFRNVAV